MLWKVKANLPCVNSVYQIDGRFVLIAGMILHLTSTPVVEQRVLIRYLPWLLWRGHWQLLVQTVYQLIRSARQQNLGIGERLRLLFQLRWQRQS